MGELRSKIARLKIIHDPAQRRMLFVWLSGVSAGLLTAAYDFKADLLMNVAALSALAAFSLGWYVYPQFGTKDDMPHIFMCAAIMSIPIGALMIYVLICRCSADLRWSMCGDALVALCIMGSLARDQIKRG